MRFTDKLQQAMDRNQSLLCVGLDPDTGRFPPHLRDQPDALERFHREIIDATADLVCAYKPQIAYFAALGAEQSLLNTLTYLRERYPHIPVILDSKRGDIGATASMYAREAFERFQADAVTVNPYMGGDTLTPFTDYTDKGVIVLCRTSNPGGADLQGLDVDGRKLYEIVAEKAAREWNRHGNVCLVVGATWPEELRRVRDIVGEMPLLVPGIGAQGGDIAAVMAAGKTTRGGLIINSSRAILYAGDGEDFAQRARAVAKTTRDEINRYR